MQKHVMIESTPVERQANIKTAEMIHFSWKIMKSCYRIFKKTANKTIIF